jgi:membrane protease YdiL (CAAX protease family)
MTRRGVWTIVWTGAFAAVMTAAVSGVWSGLLLANLKVGPAVPWSALVMALLLGALWAFLGGKWGSLGAESARRELLRAPHVAPSVLVWALIAGSLSIVALAGFWIVLRRLVATPGNASGDFSALPPVTAVATLAMAALAGAVSEEAGFRGYFQGALERGGLGPGAVLATALVMAPLHASTQGFVWPTMVFYLLVDGMLGTLAYLTKSIRPGIMVHALGLLVFFGLVWPYDGSRRLVWRQGPDVGFWLHAAQVVVFAGLGALAFVHLAKVAKRSRAAM